MRPRFLRPAETAIAPRAEQTRVQPLLADLLAQGARAAALPAWARPARARQMGLYHAPLKGRGMEYAESRPYQPGDDVRALDWRLTARSGKPHTKLFREERERPVFIAIDLRSPMAFATRGVFKQVQAARVAALLAFKAVKDGDRVGGVVLNAHGVHELPPGRGQVAVARLLRQIVSAAGATQAVEPALAALSTPLQRLVKPGALVFVLSDFRDLDAASEADFGRIAAHSQLRVVDLVDPFEQALPSLQSPLRVTAASGALDLDLGDAALRTGYQQRYAARHAHLQDFCRRHRMPLLGITTTDDPLQRLQQAAL